MVIYYYKYHFLHTYIYIYIYIYNYFQVYATTCLLFTFTTQIVKSVRNYLKKIDLESNYNHLDSDEVIWKINYNKISFTIDYVISPFMY